MRASFSALRYLAQQTILDAAREVRAMVTKTFYRHLSFVALLILLDTRLWGRGLPNPPTGEKARLTVSVYNEAAVPREVLRRAEQAASRIFQRAEIEVNWLNCQVPAASEEASRACREVAFPEHLHLRIVRKSVGLKGEAMGICFQGEDGIGSLADLFYEPMEKLQESARINVASLLAHVAAHEIGHLLLGANSHAVAGIMQARWRADELTSPDLDRRFFLDQESQKMKERLLGASQQSTGGACGAPQVGGGFISACFRP